MEGRRERGAYPLTAYEYLISSFSDEIKVVIYLRLTLKQTLTILQGI